MKHKNLGFTLVEIIIVIVILGILAVVAAPRFIDISGSARTASLQGIASQMRSTVQMAKLKAQAQGLKATPINPAGNGGASQLEYLVDFGFGSSEVDFRNLCIESQAEDGDSLDFFDFMDLTLSDDITTVVNNDYALIGYDIPRSNPPSTTRGCYIIYDSKGTPDCTVTVVTNDC